VKNNMRNRKKHFVCAPPYLQRSPNARRAPAPLQQLERYIVEQPARFAGMPFHAIAHSFSCSGYLHNYFFPTYMSPKGAKHTTLMKAHRGSNLGLLADYLYIVHFT